MAWTFSADKAVYLQIADRIKKRVLSGEYPPGAQIMTVRQLAMEAAVNPNTVQHAFSELESEGIIISKGTLGRFVTNDQQAVEACRTRMAEQIVKDFVRDMRQLSITTEQAHEMIKKEEML